MRNIAKEILEVTYQKSTTKKLEGLVKLIENGGDATEICDYLGVERRVNRENVRSVLRNQSNQ